MAKYVPSPRDWVREQVELYESSGGTRGTTLRDTGLPVILVTHTGNKTSAIRKTPLMRVKDGDSYVLVGSQGGAPKDPVWVLNLRANPQIELRDETVVRPMQVREVKDKAERDRWPVPHEAPRSGRVSWRVVIGCTGSRPGNSQPCGRAAFHHSRNRSSRTDEVIE
jgi:deazaflavin-dependent oxidoreductase (nitroreductase family)